MPKKRSRGFKPATKKEEDSSAEDDAVASFSEHEDDSSESEMEESEESEQEEEVLPITDDEEEEYEKALEIATLRSGRKLIYSTDFVDRDKSKRYKGRDQEMAKEEEENALKIQRHLYEYFDNYDDSIGVKLVADKEMIQADDEAEDESDLEDVDESSLSIEEKMKLIEKKYPELLSYKDEFMNTISELEHWSQLVKLAKEDKIPRENICKYIYQRHQAMLAYCLNISFYFLLRSNGKESQGHPVHHRIKECKAILDNFDNINENTKEEFNTIFEKIENNEEIDWYDGDQTTKVDKSKEKTAENGFLDHDTEEMDQRDADYQKMNEPEGGPGVKKRVVTREIAKNKGLVPRRKKEYRNPRVKHKIKYRKALINRKGQVKSVIREIKRYDGEPTGISTHVVRSIKMK